MANNAQWIECLDWAIDSLRESDRRLLILRFFRGKHVCEIATALNIPPDTAAKRLDRAVDRLRRVFVRRGIAPPVALAAELGTYCDSIPGAPAGLPAIIIARVLALIERSGPSNGGMPRECHL